MKIKLSHSHLLILFILAASVIYWAGMPAVPFHPDESTQIFMSSDVDLFFTRPADLFWREEARDDVRQRYRELDAPLTRYLIGISRFVLGGQPPLPADWDWTSSWQANLAAGAYPDADLLLAARLPQALLFPLTLLLLFLTLQSVAPRPAAWLGLFLFVMHGLVLLHTRRAMAEGVLLFTIMLTLWSLVRFRRSFWLAAVAAGLAFCAKQSAGILILPVIVAILWQSSRSIQQRLAQAALAVALFGAVIFALNPFLWSSPLKAFHSSIDQRATLTEQQSAMLAYVNPEKVLDSLPSRLAAQIGHLYFTEPAVRDVNNYAAEIGPAEQAYLSNSLHHLLRSPATAVGLLLLSLFGFATVFLLAVRQPTRRRSLTLLLLTNLLQMLVLLMVPLPVQRYIMPLVPFVCIWSAITLWKIIEIMLELRRPHSASFPSSQKT
jgi:4-amino-4-deoxy-L-arabinose transferase-like glycosyltransferase